MNQMPEATCIKYEPRSYVMWSLRPERPHAFAAEPTTMQPPQQAKNIAQHLMWMHLTGAWESLVIIIEKNNAVSRHRQRQCPGLRLANELNLASDHTVQLEYAWAPLLESLEACFQMDILHYSD